MSHVPGPAVAPIGSTFVDRFVIATASWLNVVSLRMYDEQTIEFTLLCPARLPPRDASSVAAVGACRGTRAGSVATIRTNCLKCLVAWAERSH